MLLATRSEKMKRQGLDGRRARRRDAHLSVPDRPDELFVVVDEHGEPIGTATRAACHSDPSLVHLSVHVVVLAHGGVLWQLRGPVQGLGAEHVGSRVLGPRVGGRGRARRSGARARRGGGDRGRRRRPRGARAGALRARRRDRADHGVPAYDTKAPTASPRPSWRGSSCCPPANAPRRCLPRARSSRRVLDAEHPGWDRA